MADVVYEPCCWNVCSTDISTMAIIRTRGLVPFLVILGMAVAIEKQIKLEDIEKDNLKADQQAKYEKQYQEYQQYQAYQQPSLSYQQQPSIAYQPQPQQQQQYVLPYSAQQYLQQALYQGNYQQLGNNGIGASYQPQAPVHPFQNYFSQQLQQVPTSQAQGQPQALVMAYSAPSLAAFQQQAAAYYQNIAPNAQIPQYYYQQQQQPDASPVPPTLPSNVYSPQQYVPPFQAVNSVRAPTGVQYSENSLASPFATSSPYTGQTYSQPQDLSFLKQSPQSAASLGQQKQYLQTIGSTVSPLQNKYLNSPQYLAQNYNTIPSTYLLPKSTYSGLKPTASPSVKIATQGGFIPSNPLTSGSTNYPAYRSISG